MNIEIESAIKFIAYVAGVSISIFGIGKWVGKVNTTLQMLTDIVNRHETEIEAGKPKGRKK